MVLVFKGTVRFSLSQEKSRLVDRQAVVLIGDQEICRGRVPGRSTFHEGSQRPQESCAAAAAAAASDAAGVSSAGEGECEVRVVVCLSVFLWVLYFFVIPSLAGLSPVSRPSLDESLLAVGCISLSLPRCSPHT